MVDCQVKDLIRLIAIVVNAADSFQLNGRKLGEFCYGLKSYNGSSSEGKELINSMIRHVKNAPRPIRQLSSNKYLQFGEISSQVAANICQSTSSFCGHHKVEMEFISCIADYLDAFQAPLTASSFAGMVSSLSCLRIQHSVSRRLTAIISRYIKNSPLVTLRASGLVSVCGGFRNMTGIYVEEQKLIDATSFHLEGMVNSARNGSHPISDINSISVCSIINDIRNLNPKFDHVERFLELIYRVSKPFGETVKIGSEIATCCHALSSRQATSDAQMKFIRFVIEIFINNPEIPLDGSYTCYALHGLKSFTGRHPLERELISLLANKIEKFPLSESITKNSLEILLEGIENLSGESAEERRLLVALNSVIMKYDGKFNPTLMYRALTVTSNLQQCKFISNPYDSMYNHNQFYTTRRVMC